MAKKLYIKAVAGTVTINDDQSAWQPLNDCREIKKRAGGNPAKARSTQVRLVAAANSAIEIVSTNVNVAGNCGNWPPNDWVFRASVTVDGGVSKWASIKFREKTRQGGGKKTRRYRIVKCKDASGAKQMVFCCGDIRLAVIIA